LLHGQEAGYIRQDRFDPDDQEQGRDQEEINIVNIRSLTQLAHAIGNQASLKDIIIYPSWNPILILLKKSYLPSNPYTIFHETSMLHETNFHHFGPHGFMIQRPSEPLLEELKGFIATALIRRTSCEEVDDGDDNWIHVCNMYRGKNINGEESVISKIKDTIPWIQTVSFIRAMSNSLDLCAC
jgi:hypothetical protein